MLTKKFIIDFIGTNFYCEKINREIHGQNPMTEEETIAFVEEELKDMLDRHEIAISNSDIFEERVKEIAMSISR